MGGNDDERVLADWMTKDQFLAEYTMFNKHALNGLLFHREENGLHEHVKLVYNRIYISRSGFLEWFLSHNDKGRRPQAKPPREPGSRPRQTRRPPGAREER